jgi:hypothetical protein
MHFVVDEAMHTIPFGEAFNQVLLVQAYTIKQSAGDAGIERPVAFARKNIHAGLFGHAR